MFDRILNISLIIFKGKCLIFSQMIKSFTFYNTTTETSLLGNTQDVRNFPSLKYIVTTFEYLNRRIEIEIGKRKNKIEKGNYVEEICKIHLVAQTINLT